MRWKENFTSILKEKGYNIIWTAPDGNLEESTEFKVQVEFEKEGVKEPIILDEFLEKEVDESLHEFIRTNVFIATRNFVHRLKIFRKEIMMGHNNPMAIENWCDKMEFQGRGAAHIHGVAWCNLVKVSQVLDMEDREPPSEDEFEDDDNEVINN